LGFVATSASEGAGKWSPDLNEYFRGRTVYILPDFDAPGTKHAEDIARNLHGIAREVRIVDLPGLEKEGEDVANWFEQGNTREGLVMLAEEAPQWKAMADELPSDVQTAAPERKTVRTLTKFLANFVPPDYLIEGILQHHYFYTLTGMTGAGKTAIAL